MRTYRFSLEYVLDALPWNQGLALKAWAIENDPDLIVERKTPGYVAREVERQTNERQT